VGNTLKGTEMLSYFTKLHCGDRDEAVKSMAGRLGWLLTTTDLSAIEADQFRTLCQLLNGIALDELVDGKECLGSIIADALQQQEVFRDEIKDKTFADDSPDSRAEFLHKLDVEREHLTALAHIIDTFDATACLTLLVRAQEVYGAEGENLEARCASVYAKIQSRRQL
jgi:hypothetical protein